MGSITHTLRSQKGQYLFELAAVSELPIPMELGGNEQSEGIWQEGYPQPLHYSHEHNYGNKNKHQALSFNWDNHQVINEVNQRHMTVNDGIQDKLSYQLALRQELRQQGKKLTFQVTDGKHIKTYRFRKEPHREWLDTSLGSIEAVRLELISDKGTTRVWAAPAYDYLWVKFEHEQNNGISISAIIDTLESAKTIKEEK